MADNSIVAPKPQVSYDAIVLAGGAGRRLGGHHQGRLADLALLRHVVAHLVLRLQHRMVAHHEVAVAQAARETGIAAFMVIRIKNFQ